MTTLLRGTMLAPGVSANRRLYTPELIQRAHDKLAERIKDGSNPVTMLTYHEANDDSTKIVGRITSVKMNGDKLDYTAELADTEEANTIGRLVAPKDGKPFLRGVSIRGWWVGDPTTKTVEGMSVTTADDMEIDGLDFTKSPGVTGAFAAPADSKATETSLVSRMVIRESVDTHATFTEAQKGTPYGSVRYADPGYQADKVKRYPLDTQEHAKAAWGYLREQNTQQYTAPQMKRVRARIKSALQKFGVDAMTETMPEPLTEAATTLSEYYDYVSPEGRAGFSISAYNGPLTVTVSAYSGVEPADLPDVAMAAMKAACDAIHALDPDDDGDIDTGASEESPDDNQMETAPASETVKESEMDDTTEESPAAAEETEETPAAPETAAEDEATADESAPITRADLKEAVAEAVSAALATSPNAGAAEAVEEQAPTEESAPTDADLRETIRQEVIRESLANGSITRKGLVEQAGAEPDKPLHEMTDEEFRAYQQERSDIFFVHNQ